MEPEISIKTVHGVVTEVMPDVVKANGRKWHIAFVSGITGGPRFQMSFPVELKMQPHQYFRALSVEEKGKSHFYPLLQNMTTGAIAHEYMRYQRLFSPLNFLLSLLSATFFALVAGGVLWALNRYGVWANAWSIHAGMGAGLVSLLWDAYVAHYNHSSGNRYLKAIKLGIERHFDARNWAQILVRRGWRKLMISAMITQQPNRVDLGVFDPTHIKAQPRGIKV